MSRCFFRCSYEIAEIGPVLRDAKELEFSIDRPRLSVVRLSMTDWDGQKAMDGSSAVCTGETAADEVDETVEFCKDVVDELYSSMVSIVTIFIWRCGLTDGPPNPGHNSRGYWSNDGKSWRQVPMMRSLGISLGIPYRTITGLDVIRNDVDELIKTAGPEEPLGRQLFREAWNQRTSRPMSSLVIGVAAAEVGFKKLLGSLVPPAQWLVDELQTPPLGKMLRKFLPTLPVKLMLTGKSICPPNTLLNQLDDAVTHRNKLVHAGQLPPGAKELEKMLRAVNDLLWICDLYAGHGWALNYISDETLTAWR
jgi:hypothetical protein